MILLDTTVLVYAVGRDHPLAAPSRAVLRSIGAGTVQAVTTPEVIQEFTHVRARRTGRDDAVVLAREFRTLLSLLVTVGEDDLDDGLALFAAHDGLGAFDSVLAAVAVRRRANLLSADRGFASVGALGFVNLTAPDLRDSL